MNKARRLIEQLKIGDPGLRWTLKDAQDFLKKLQPKLRRAGYIGKIIGSVASKGFSEHDLDILLIPIKDDFDFEPLYVELGGEFTYGEDGEYYQFSDDKGRVIDLIFTEESKK